MAAPISVVEVPTTTRAVAVPTTVTPWEPPIVLAPSHRWLRRFALIVVCTAIGGAVAWVLKSKLDGRGEESRREYATEVGHHAGPQPNPEVEAAADERDPIDEEGRVKA